MNYAEKAEQAQQEQLDWLAQIADESRTQTQLLRKVGRHTGLLYALAVVWIVLVGIYLLARLYDLTN